MSVYLFASSQSVVTYRNSWSH